MGSRRSLSQHPVHHMPHTRRKEPPRSTSTRKLWTWGNPATLLISGEILVISGDNFGLWSQRTLNRTPVPSEPHGPPNFNALENKGRNALKARQNRGRGIEQRPVPEIAMGMRHDQWPAAACVMRENADQPAAFPELAAKVSRHDLGRAVEHDDIIGRVAGSPPAAARGPDRDIAASRAGRGRPCPCAQALASLSVAVTWPASCATHGGGISGGAARPPARCRSP